MRSDLQLPTRTNTTNGEARQVLGKLATDHPTREACRLSGARNVGEQTQSHTLSPQRTLGVEDESV